jgi:hypothetical protein
MSALEEVPAISPEQPFSDPDEKEIEQKMIKTILNMPKEV